MNVNCCVTNFKQANFFWDLRHKANEGCRLVPDKSSLFPPHLVPLLRSFRECRHDCLLLLVYKDPRMMSSHL